MKKVSVLVDIAMNAERTLVAGVIKDLICDRENLIAALKEVDTECRFCKRHDRPVPCQENSTEYLCDECIYDCICRNCHDNSNYIWRGEVEGNG